MRERTALKFPPTDGLRTLSSGADITQGGGLNTTVVCDIIAPTLLPIFDYGGDALGLFANEEKILAAEAARV